LHQIEQIKMAAKNAENNPNPSVMLSAAKHLLKPVMVSSSCEDASLRSA